MTGDTWGGVLAKPSRTARKIREHKEKLKLDRDELDNKAFVRRRDRFCRFPMCGCGRLKMRGEVSHGQHKGMGGNPAGDRSLAALMVLLCPHRHQHASVSIHAGTLKPRFLTSRKYGGPIAWLVDVSALSSKVIRTHWREVARESAINVWEPFHEWQYEILHRLGEMVR